jgi:hypothetical protein
VTGKANHHHAAAMNPIEAKKSASGVRKAIDPVLRRVYRWVFTPFARLRLTS